MSDWVQPSPGSTIAFVAIVAAVVVMILAGIAWAGRRASEPAPRTRSRVLGVGLGAGVWLALTAWLSESGALSWPGPPPALMLFFAGSMAVALGFALSPLGRRLAELPLAALLGFQAFRLPLELVLHTWYGEGVIPAQMTFEGHNFDIVTGVLAVAIALWGWRGRPPRAAYWVVNVLGSALLLAVMVIAVLSAPLPIKAYAGPDLLIALHAPYGWIVPFCVGGALAGHVITFRALLRPGGFDARAVEVG